MSGSEPPLNIEEETWKELSAELDYSVVPKKKEEIQPSDFQFDDTALKYILFAVIILLFIIALISLLKKVPSGVKTKRKREAATSIEEAENNLPQVDLDKLLTQSIAKKDYRSALRLRFLMLLQALFDNGFVVWKKRKTNEQYLKEFTDQKIRNHFSDVVTLYDTAWYGNHELSEEVFAKADVAIQSINQQIQSDER
jgi:hypothetical protein